MKRYYFKSCEVGKKLTIFKAFRGKKKKCNYVIGVINLKMLQREGRNLIDIYHKETSWK